MADGMLISSGFYEDLKRVVRWFKSGGDLRAPSGPATAIVRQPTWIPFRNKTGSTIPAHGVFICESIAESDGAPTIQAAKPSSSGTTDATGMGIGLAYLNGPEAVEDDEVGRCLRPCDELRKAKATGVSVGDLCGMRADSFELHPHLPGFVCHGGSTNGTIWVVRDNSNPVYAVQMATELTSAASQTGALFTDKAGVDCGQSVDVEGKLLGTAKVTEDGWGYVQRNAAGKWLLIAAECGVEEPAP